MVAADAAKMVASDSCQLSNSIRIDSFMSTLSTDFRYDPFWLFVDCIECRKTFFAIDESFDIYFGILDDLCTIFYTAQS
jgi:hypothetical protein